MIALLLATLLLQDRPELAGAFVDLGETLADSALLDVDGDQDLDLVGPEWQLGKLNVRLGNGDGSFTPGPTVAHTVPIAERVCPIDLDGDAWTDLVIGYQSFAGILLLHGTGSASAPFSVGSMVSISFFPDSLVPGDWRVADVDGDGDEDIVCFQSVKDRLFVLLSQAGTLVEGPSITLSTAPFNFPAGLVVADVDHDGVVDVLAANVHELRWLHGLGGGRFAPAVVALSLSGSQQFRAIESADLDADGELDLVTTSSTSTDSYRGHGDGSFTPWWSIPVQGSDSMLLEDLTGDAVPDLAVSTPQGLASFQGLGDGSFVPRSSIPTAFTPRHLHRGDINGDGRPDVVSLTNDGRAALFPGAGDASLHGLETEPLALSDGISAAELSDVDGDGDLDLHVLHYESIEILRNDGTGDFTAGQLLLPGALANMDGLAVGAEGIWATSLTQRALLAWPATGGGGFGAPIATALLTPPFELAAGDLNGDGRTDAVVTMYPGWDPVTLLGSGDGHFTPSPGSAPFHPTGLAWVALGQLDGDGLMDLATADDLSISFLSGAGDGSFALSASLPLPDKARNLALGDLDADGDLDAALTLYSKQLLVVRNTGAGGFVADAPAALNVYGNDVELADLDRDGLLEILVPEAHLIDVLAPRAQGYELVSEHEGISGFGFLATGDIDGDLDVDAMLPATSTVAILGNRLDAWDGLGHALGSPLLAGEGTLVGGTPMSLRLSEAAPNAVASLILGVEVQSLPFKGGTLLPKPLRIVPQLVAADGTVHVTGTWPPGIPAGAGLVLQTWVVDAGGPQGFSASNGLRAVQP